MFPTINNKDSNRPGKESRWERAELKGEIYKESKSRYRKGQKNKKKVSKSQAKSRHYLEMVEQISINIYELPGAIFRIPDKWWKFYAPGRQEHPGACIECDENKKIATMVKGTGGESKLISSKSYVTIYPTDNNGLKKPTYFHLQPRPFRFHRIFLLYPERYIGKLDEEDLKLIRHKLNQLFLETLGE